MADKNKGGMVLSYVNSMPCVLWLFKTKPHRIFSCMAKIVLHFVEYLFLISIKSIILRMNLYSIDLPKI